MLILNHEKILDIVSQIDLIKIIEEGFSKYSAGKVVVPPVGEMLFSDPPGEVHIKYGYIQDDNYYVIKIASGFYENSKLGLSSSNGLMLLFDQQNGLLKSILLDEGHLTNLRTAAAGAVVARYLAPKEIKQIGIFGAGVQGKLQLAYLKDITSCRNVMVWGINQKELNAYKAEMSQLGFKVRITQDSQTITKSCNFIVCATPSTTPLIQANQVLPGTHISAVGSDTPEKQELDAEILKKADLIVADSISQCQSRGEIFHALKNDYIELNEVIELGQIINREKQGRTSDDQISIADLTGVAVQDIQIAKAVYEACT